MELARYKRCFLCNEVALWTKRFPPASRPDKQREWVLRLNKDDEETADLLNKHRQKKDPRWCERHFDKQIDDLPIDHRAVPARSLTLPTVPLRTTRPADLHPKAEHNSRLHESASWHERASPVQQYPYPLGLTIIQANPALASIYQKFFNHLYCVHNKYPLLKDRKRALEVVRSFVMHIQGKHKWKKGDGFEIVTKCEHGRLKKLKKGEKREILANSDELELVRTLVFAPKFEKAFLTAASLIDTSINECYHSLSFMYAPKISPPYYKLKMLVSMLHYNGLMLDDLLGQRAEIGNTVLKRKGRLVGAIKRKRGAGTHVWRGEILAESLKVREELSEAREIARLGIPEDDVFDELVNWWDMKE
ncbi:hypothetical protein PMAYCL1PPCAC_05709, partial [Pristionchus mayeri]